MAELIVEHATRSRGRTANRDFVTVERLDAVYLALGSAYGRSLVPQTAIATFREHVSSDVEPSGQRVAEALVAVDRALVALEGRDDSEYNWDPDAASIVAASIDKELATVAWVGNARAYHLRGAEVRAVTAEHSLLTEARATGHPLTRAQEKDYLRLGITTRVLGAMPDAPEVSTAIWKLAPGDRLLLCSRGVYQALADDEIASLSDGRHGARRLVNAASGHSERAATALIAWAPPAGELPRAVARERR